MDIYYLQVTKGGVPTSSASQVGGYVDPTLNQVTIMD